MGLTEVAEASVESWITQTGSIGPVAAPVIGTITFLIALLPIEALRTACTQETTKSEIIKEKFRNKYFSLGKMETTHHPGTSLHLLQVDSGSSRWRDHSWHHFYTYRGRSSFSQSIPQNMLRDRKIKGLITAESTRLTLWLDTVVTEYACVCVSGVSLWLQTMPIHPSGQSQPVFHGLHFPPLEQSSHVKLQSLPKVSSKHTGDNRLMNENKAHTAF